MRSSKLIALVVAALTVSAFSQATPTATLTASQPWPQAGFGSQVAISGSTIVSSGEAYINGLFQDILFVFVKPASSPWADMTESAQLISGKNRFGPDAAVRPAISGDGNTIVAIDQSGNVNVFVKPAGGWHGTLTPAATLLQGYGGRPWVIQGQITSLAINAKGDTIVAGAYTAGTQGHRSEGKQVAGIADQGAVYVWTVPPGGWATADGAAQTAKLTASDGVAYDELGWSVGISANTVVASAPAFVSGLSTGHGAVYVFVKPATGWINTSRFKSKFNASDEKHLDAFGDVLAVGQSGALVAVSAGLGKAYLFARSSSAWPTTMTETAVLTPSDSGGIQFGGSFGDSLSVGENFVTIGAPTDGNGAAYTFARPATGWANLSLPASMVGANEASAFGASNSSSGRTTVVGAPNTPEGGQQSAGAVYVFSN